MRLEAILLVAALHFSIRLPLIRHVPKGVDAYFHLLASSKFSKGRPPKCLGKFFVGDEYTHPPLLHLVLSFLPERVRPKALFTLGTIADFALALLTYFLASQYVGEPYALAAALIYSVSPASYLQSVSESARPLGALWYSLSIVLLPSRSIPTMTLAAVTVALTLLSHKMATQTLLFSCLLMTPVLYPANNLFPLELMLGLVLALLLTKGGYVATLRDHMRYLGFHLKHGSWDQGKKRPGHPKWLIKLQPYFYIPIIAFFLNPQVFSDGIPIIFIWYISVLAIFFIWLWGDSYRYLAYSTVPTAILSALAIYETVSLWLIVPALLVSAVLISKSVFTFYRQAILPDFTKIHTVPNSVTLVMPSSLNYISACYLKGKILFGGGNSKALEFELETLTWIMSAAPERLLKEYPISNALLSPKHQDFLKPIGDKFERVTETNGYVLLRRKRGG